MWGIHWHSRTHHDEILSTKSSVAVASGFNCDPVIEKQWNLASQLILWFRIGYRHSRAMLL
jgi:hypothetical protein